MDKQITLKLNNGSLETGFSAILQISDEGASPTVEIAGRLPPAPALKSIYQRWQVAYRYLGHATRIQIQREGVITNVSLVEDCDNLSSELHLAFMKWLQSDSFRPVQEKLLERLNPDDTVRLILQTEQGVVQRLPWHLWEICDRYPKLEIALSAPTYEKKTDSPAVTRTNIRILAILGHSQGLDLETDRALLNHLPNADVHFLVEPDRQTLDAHLWDATGWDILFFAGHSSTVVCPQNTVGQLHINPTDTLTIPQLKHALRRALSRGLKIAIFNSCEGLGLAQALADLYISQILVMREPIPDPVAHTFLKSFLEAFSRGEPFYLAVREAREKLQALEDQFPCASWLPTIYQNPAESPPTWQSLCKPVLPDLTLALASASTSPLRQAQSPATPSAYSQPTEQHLTYKHGQYKQGQALAQSVSQGVKQRSYRPRLSVVLATHIVVMVALFILRAMSFFQAWELKALDRLMRSRPQEMPDSRLVVITITPADIQAQDAEERRGSLSDPALLKLLNKLETLQPRVIGLDIYRDFPVKSNLPELASKLENTPNLMAVCKSPSSTEDIEEVTAPPEVPGNQVGFSDVVVDPDGVIRRQLLSFTPELSSRCAASYSLNALVALKFLATEGYLLDTSSEGYLQVNEKVFPALKKNDGGYQDIDDNGHQLLLNYRNLKDQNPENIAESITLTEVLEGHVNADMIRDRIVLIGITDNSYPDSLQTPYSESPNSQHRTAGVFMQAQMVSQLISAVIDNRPLLNVWPETLENLWIMLWGSVGSVLILTLARSQVEARSSPQLLLALLVTELGILGLCWLLFTQSHVWVPVVSSAIAPIAVTSSYSLSARLSLLFDNNNNT